MKQNLIRGKCILQVDDEPIVCGALRMVQEFDGHTVTEDYQWPRGDTAPTSAEGGGAGQRAVALAWPSTLGRQYQLQSAPSLPGASWANEGDLLAGTGGVLTTNLPSGAATQKFSRLQVNQ